MHKPDQFTEGPREGSPEHQEKRLEAELRKKLDSERQWLDCVELIGEVVRERMHNHADLVDHRRERRGQIMADVKELSLVGGYKVSLHTDRFSSEWRISKPDLAYGVEIGRSSEVDLQRRVPRQFAGVRPDKLDPDEVIELAKEVRAAKPEGPEIEQAEAEQNIETEKIFQECAEALHSIVRSKIEQYRDWVEVVTQGDTVTTTLKLKNGLVVKSHNAGGFDWYDEITQHGPGYRVEGGGLMQRRAGDMVGVGVSARDMVRQGGKESRDEWRIRDLIKRVEEAEPAL